MTAPAVQLRELDIELTRIVDRLNSMPLTRAGSVSDECCAVAEMIVNQTRAIGGDVPADAQLPRLGPQGLGALVAVLGRDYEKAVKAAPLPDIQPVLDRLIELRRSLP